MKKLLDLNPNTRVYWDIRYDGQDNRVAYEKETGESRFIRALDEIKDGQKVIDMGCGIGTFCSMIKGYYPTCEVWGTDISEKVIWANGIANPTIKYLHEYIGNQTDVPSDYFDVVFSGEVLEHLDEPSDLFKDAQRVLRKGGKFIVSTPNGSNIKSPEHMWEFTQDDVLKLFTDNGFVRPQFIYLPNREHELVIMAVGRKA